MEIKNGKLWIKNDDCINFLKKIPDNSVDLILTDPPFGLGESKFDIKHYARNKNNVIKDYFEAPNNISYEEWVYNWISEFDRILKKNGTVLIVSGWSNEADVQYAFRKNNKFKLINHLIWNFNFGVYTSCKFVSSHYHILYYCKKNGKPFFNKYAYHNESHKTPNGRSMLYDDLQDVIRINKEFKPKQEKNSNTLPSKLIEKLIKHTTKVGDVVLDIFSGEFTTQFAALKLKRIAWGCEINKKCCEKYFPLLKTFKNTYSNKEDLEGFTKDKSLLNQGKKITENERNKIINFYNTLSGTKKYKIQCTSDKFKRGVFSIQRIIKNINN